MGRCAGSDTQGRVPRPVSHRQQMAGPIAGCNERGLVRTSRQREGWPGIQNFCGNKLRPPRSLIQCHRRALLHKSYRSTSQVPVVSTETRQPSFAVVYETVGKAPDESFGEVRNDYHRSVNARPGGDDSIL
jgi:hypothetical protein